MNYEFKIAVTVKENCSPFAPNVTTYEFEVIAEGEQEAMKLASGKVLTKGYPYDETKVQVLSSKPLLTESELQEIVAKTDHLMTIEEMRKEAA